MRLAYVSSVSSWVFSCLFAAALVGCDNGSSAPPVDSGADGRADSGADAVVDAPVDHAIDGAPDTVVAEGPARDTAADRAGDTTSPDGGICWPVIQQQWGTDQDDHAIRVLFVNDTLYIAGYEGGRLGVENVEPVGDSTGFIEATRAGGDSHRYQLATSGSDVIEAIAPHPGGGLVFAGRTTAALPEAMSGGKYDLVAGVLDRQGTATALIQAGGRGPEHPTRVVAVRDMVYVAGYDDTLVPSNYVEAWEDPFAFAWRPTAPTTSFWHRFNTSAPDVVRGLAIDEASGDIYVVGATQAGVGQGAFVARVNSRDGTRWTETITRSGLDDMAAVAALPNGDLLLAGSTVTRLGERAIGLQDAFVARFDPQRRVLVWVSQFGTTASDLLTDMAVDGEGNIHVVGETLGRFDAPAAAPTAESDIFVVTLSPTGVPTKTWQGGSPGDDRPTSITVGPCQTLIISGATNGALIPGAQPPKRYDAFVMTVP